MTITRGLLARLEAKSGKEEEVEQFLRSALPLAQQESATIVWFAIKFGRGEYGIFDAFPDDSGRDAHLGGPIAAALMARAGELLAKPPQIQKADVLASKLPDGVLPEPDMKGVLLTFAAKSGNEPEVEQFLRDAQPLAAAEPKTNAWFAIHLDDGHYGIFDVFPDNGARFAHLTGHIPRELAKHALTILGSVPDLTLLDVLAEKLGE